VAATGGEEGLRLAKELRPAVITLDVLMPGLDGWAVLTTLKADPELADIPVIVLTILDDKNLGYALGAADFVTKPIERERLLAVLGRHRPDRRAGSVLVVDDDPDVERGFRSGSEALLELGRYDDGGFIYLDRFDYRWVSRQAQIREALAAAHAFTDDERYLTAGMEGGAAAWLRPRGQGAALSNDIAEWRGHLPFLHELDRLGLLRDLTPDDHRRLNGGVETILQKGAYSRERLLAEVRQRLAGLVRQPAAG